MNHHRIAIYTFSDYSNVVASVPLDVNVEGQAFKTQEQNMMLEKSPLKLMMLTVVHLDKENKIIEAKYHLFK